MQVFEIRKEIRKVGLNYGLPVWIVDCGPGVSYNTEDLIFKMISMGLRKGDWIVVKDGMGQKGVGVLVEALKGMGVHIEIEAGSRDDTPKWFPKVDRWTVYWNGEGLFNLGSLRPRQDILMGSSDFIMEFLEFTKGFGQIEKGVIGKVDFEVAWNNKLRMYEDVK